MNVAFEPWIPVVTNEGKPDLASLCSILIEGDRYADLAVRPHERVALMRLFLCVAHAALEGPKNYAEWCDVPKRLPDAVRKYLSDWKDSFELFHKEKPWLQVAELSPIPSDKTDDRDAAKTWTPLSRLCLTRASGNNTTLFDHLSNGATFMEHIPEEIALNLLTFQNFFVAGGKASSRLWGTIEMKSPANPKGGPCSGKSIIFTFLRGKNIYESVQLNLSTYEDLKFLYGDSENWLGKPLWEMPIKSPSDNASIKNATQTHIGRLVPQTRMLRVNEDRKTVLLGPGFTYPKFQDENNTFYPDLFATVVLNDQGKRILLSAKPNRALWRELHSLIVCRKSASNSSRGPLCLLNIPDTSPCDIIANAMITNPKQAADIVDLVESVFNNIPVNLRTPEGSSIYQFEVQESEFWANRLSSSVSLYRKEMDDKWKRTLEDADKTNSKSSDIEKARRKKYVESMSPLYSIVTAHYWTDIERNLPLLMAHIEAIGPDNAMPTRAAWRKMLFSAACNAYRTACARETPRQMRAFAKGWKELVS